MSEQYTAQRIEGTTAGWLVIDTATGKKHVVFCNASANTAEDAVALITAPQVESDHE